MKYVSIDTIMAAFIILPIVFSILAIMLPFQLKFGGEKKDELQSFVLSSWSSVFSYGYCHNKSFKCIPYQFELPLPSNSQTCLIEQFSFLLLLVLQFSRSLSLTVLAYPL